MLFNQFRVFLSASIPDPGRDPRFRLINDAQVQIEEAVITLARAVFEHRGQLVFGGHPSITRIIAMVAAEFDLVTEAEDMRKAEITARPLVLYQSEIYLDKTPFELKLLQSQGYTQIEWVPATGGETFDNPASGPIKYPKSMEHLRKTMFSTNLDAMVCIGGMEGIINEVELFTEAHPHSKIYLLPSTDGATRLIARGEYKSEKINRRNLVIYDTEIFGKYRDEFVNELNTGNDNEFNPGISTGKENQQNIEFNYDPYTFLTALIVEDITRNKG